MSRLHLIICPYLLMSELNKEKLPVSGLNHLTSIFGVVYKKESYFQDFLFWGWGEIVNNQ